MRVFWAVLFLMGAGCHRVAVSEAVDAQPATPATASPVDAGPVATGEDPDAFDPPKTKKFVDELEITYVNASRLGTSAFLGFAIDNKGAEEQAISSVLSIQATTRAGLSGEMNLKHSKCDGMAPPHGRFVCVVEYKFTDAPTELRVRVEGAWFHIRVEDGDAGKH